MKRLKFVHDFLHP